MEYYINGVIVKVLDGLCININTNFKTSQLNLPDEVCGKTCEPAEQSEYLYW